MMEEELGYEKERERGTEWDLCTDLIKVLYVL